MTRPRAAIGGRGDGRPAEACQREIGVTHYRWRFVNTKRGCRHAEREGKTYSWDEPPTGGHPGAEAGCACSAEAVLPDLDDLRDLIRHGPGSHPQPHPDPRPLQQILAALLQTYLCGFGVGCEVGR